MRAAGLALMVAVVLGGIGAAASAAPADASASPPAPVMVAQSTGQAGDAEGAKSDEKRFAVSLEYSGFFPTDGETQDNFGSTWHSIGIGLFRPVRPDKWLFDWDVSWLSKDGPSDVVLFPVTVGVQRGWGKDPDTQPYVAARVGPYWGKVDDNLMGPDDSKLGANANLALGVVLNQRYVIEARYDWFTKLAGNDFNGFTVTAGVKVYEFKL